MKTGTKCIIAVIAVIAAIIVSCTLLNAELHAADTTIRNELAIHQMENTADSSLLYEEYRNIYNSVGFSFQLSILCFALVFLFILLLFRKEIKSLFKKR